MKVRPPGPENTPDKVALPDDGDVMVPPVLVTRKFRLDWLPGASVSVPPVNTGVVVVPTLASEVVPPADILVGTGGVAGVGVVELPVGVVELSVGVTGVNVTTKSQISKDPSCKTRLYE